MPHEMKCLLVAQEHSVTLIVFQSHVHPFLLEVDVHLKVLQYLCITICVCSFTIVRALNEDSPSMYMDTLTVVGCSKN
jgi:hypothetical protein